MPTANKKTYALFAQPNNQKIIAALESEKAEIFQFSPLEIEKAVLDEKSISYLKNLETFDWIIFPDILSVEYFLQALEENEIDFFEMDATRVCAFGEAVADCLRFVQLHADVVPTLIETKNIFQALTEYIGENNFEKLKFLLPKEFSIEYEIALILTEKFSTVIELPIYKTNISNSREVVKLKTLLAGGAIDEFIFSSPTDLIALEKYLGERECGKIFAEIKVSAVDKNIFRFLRENGFEPCFFKI